MTIRTFLTVVPVGSAYCCITNGRSQHLSNTQELKKACTDSSNIFSNILDHEIKKVNGYGNGIQIII